MKINLRIKKRILNFAQNPLYCLFVAAFFFCFSDNNRNFFIPINRYTVIRVACILELITSSNSN